MSYEPYKPGVAPSNETTSKSTPLPTQNQSTQPDYSTPPITTTQKSISIGSCPSTLSEPTNSKTLFSLNETTNLTAFKKYSISYVSPADSTIAILMFEFKTIWGSWYLDDVSIKESTSRAELIDNGGFETGNLGSQWKFCDSRYSWITVGSVVNHTSNSGSYSYESKDTRSGSEEYLTQTFDIKGNTRYTIEFYLYYSGQPTLAEVTLISH